MLKLIVNTGYVGGKDGLPRGNKVPSRRAIGANLEETAQGQDHRWVV